MFTSQRAKSADPEILALVEFDMQKMRVHIVLSREAIRERLRELEHSSPTRAQPGKARLNFLERWLVESRATIVIPFDNRVFFVSLLNCAKFSSWLSEVAQTLDPIFGSQLLAGG